MTAAPRRARRTDRLLTFVPADAETVSVAGIVFDRTHARSSTRLWIGGALALATYGALGTWAVLRPPRHRSFTVPVPEMAVELFALPPPAPPPPPPPAPRVRVPSPPTNSAAPPSERPAAPAPAQAAAVVAREAPPDEPVDLTSFSIATGTAARYAGGDTSSSGTNTHAVTGAAPGGRGLGAGPAEVDHSRPVGIPETEWSDCPWPQEADALGIDEQVVSMKAVARADGSFESADIVADPGHGFGAALLACARRHGFVPALDRRGQPVRARSGTIRFTFTR